MPVIIDGKRYAARSIPRHHVLEEIIKKNQMEREKMNSMAFCAIEEDQKRECCLVM